MNMILAVNVLVTVILVAIVILIIRIRNMDKRLKATEAFIRGLIAHSKNVPAPTDPALHQAWLKRFNELKEGPKRTAYKNRLIEVGMLDEEGHAKAS
jgi:hypothetical protein